MAMADPPVLFAPDPAARGRTLRRRVWVFLALAALLLFIGSQVRTLWHEWEWLQAERSWARQSVVIGYPNISPRVSYAQPPENWFRHKGEFTYLWGGWDSHEGHLWFQIDRGDVDETVLTLPVGRDVHRAIDDPLIEAEGGPIWGRIPSDAPVVGFDLAGVAIVYPILVLDRVQVVNDLIDRRPILVTYNPFSSPDEAVKVYEATLDGERVTMGTSGYYEAKTPLLYDRGSESLWKDQGETLRAIAGPRKGRTLRQFAHPVPVAWGAWSGRNPRSRLLVGADRSRPAPHASPSSLASP